MAERRMFAKTIVDSDNFLDMPLSTQNLYFHLGMRADDDGFINNPRRIQRLIGATDDDLKLLIAKGYLITFETGVVVITHWKIHNYIQKDRYKATAYQEEKDHLYLKRNNAYTLNAAEKSEKEKKPLTEAQQKRLNAKKESDLPYSFDYKIRNAFVGKRCPICNCVMDYSNNLTKPTIQHNKPISLGGKHEIDNISVICNSCNLSIQNSVETEPLNTDLVKEIWECIGNVSGMDTQVRLGKERKDKEREDKVREDKERENVQPVSNECPIEELYIKYCPNLTPYLPNNYSSEVTALQKAIHNKLLSWSDIEKAFKMANESDFLCGRVKDWKADFKWLIKPENIKKVLNGNYKNIKDSKKSEIYEHDYGDINELEKQMLRKSYGGK